MASVRKLGNGPSIRDMKGRLQRMPRTVAARVASAVAPMFNTLAGEAWDAGRTVYGEARPRGTDGAELTLYASGATRGSLRFEAIGTIVRCKLSTPWAKYLIGKYRVLPVGDRAALPVKWQRALEAIVARVMREEAGAAGRAAA